MKTEQTPQTRGWDKTEKLRIETQHKREQGKTEPLERMKRELDWWSSRESTFQPSTSTTSVRCCWLYLHDLLFGQLQLVWFVGPQQLGLRLPLLLQHRLSVLPALPRFHPLVKRPLQGANTHTHTHFMGFFFSLLRLTVHWILLRTLTAPSRRM